MQRYRTISSTWGWWPAAFGPERAAFGPRSLHQEASCRSGPAGSSHQDCASAVPSTSGSISTVAWGVGSPPTCRRPYSTSGLDLTLPSLRGRFADLPLASSVLPSKRSLTPNFNTHSVCLVPKTAVPLLEQPPAPRSRRAAAPHGAPRSSQQLQQQQPSWTPQRQRRHHHQQQLQLLQQQPLQQQQATEVYADSTLRKKKKKIKKHKLRKRIKLERHKSEGKKRWTKVGTTSGQDRSSEL